MRSKAGMRAAKKMIENPELIKAIDQQIKSLQ